MSNRLLLGLEDGGGGVEGVDGVGRMGDDGVGGGVERVGRMGDDEVEVGWMGQIG